MGSLKINTDVSVRDGRALGGDLVLDHEAKLIFAFYKEFREVEVLLAEALSLRYGLQLCVVRALEKLEVEVDSEVLVRLIVATSLVGWPICNVFRDIRLLLKDLESTITHVYHEANSSTDKLVGLQTTSTTYSILSQLPSIV
ncbi:uncharacterized protein [Coffea arabica]|uniref:RNase H type-1 domain-containing protein n=1 Tax=Coffea arabica TaxID=13443 RepID=A0ABM4VH45_COFAR